MYAYNSLGCAVFKEVGFMHRDLCCTLIPLLWQEGQCLNAGRGAKHAACLPWSQCFNDFVADSSRTAIRYQKHYIAHSIACTTNTGEGGQQQTHFSTVTVVDVRSAVYKAIFLRPRPPRL